MSRRFGRNQRRKLRDEVARLEAVSSGHYADKLTYLRRLERAEGEMVEWADRILTLLGPNSAFARELNRLGVDAGYFANLLEGMPMRLEAPGVTSLRPRTAEAVRIAADVVEAFAVYAVHEDDFLSRRVRFEVAAPDGRAAIMMDHQTLHLLRGRGGPELKRYLMNRLLGPFMADALKRTGGQAR